MKRKIIFLSTLTIILVITNVFITKGNLLRVGQNVNTLKTIDMANAEAILSESTTKPAFSDIESISFAGAADDPFLSKSPYPLKEVVYRGTVFQLSGSGCFKLSYWSLRHDKPIDNNAMYKDWFWACIPEKDNNTENVNKVYDLFLNHPNAAELVFEVTGFLGEDDDVWKVHNLMISKIRLAKFYNGLYDFERYKITN